MVTVVLMNLRDYARKRLAAHAVRRLPVYAKAKKPIYVGPLRWDPELLIPDFGKNRFRDISLVHGELLAERVLASGLMRLYGTLVAVVGFAVVAAASFGLFVATFDTTPWKGWAGFLLGGASFMAALILYGYRRDRFPNPFATESIRQITGKRHAWATRRRYLRDLPAQLADQGEIDLVLTRAGADAATIDTAHALVEVGWDGPLGQLPEAASRLSA